ncbi:hypothetical protein ASPZODRAFT_124475, partial [Penicilliopsis zonata CBS 506.65]
PHCLASSDPRSTPPLPPLPPVFFCHKSTILPFSSSFAFSFSFLLFFLPICTPFLSSLSEERIPFHPRHALCSRQSSPVIVCHLVGADRPPPTRLARHRT